MKQRKDRDYLDTKYNQNSSDKEVHVIHETKEK